MWLVPIIITEMTFPLSLCEDHINLIMYMWVGGWLGDALGLLTLPTYTSERGVFVFIVTEMLFLFSFQSML